MNFDPQKIKNPDLPYRLHMLTHDWGTDYAAHLQRVKEGGAGGVVTNVPWNNRYQQDEEAFSYINTVVDAVEKEGLQLWLYDEKGYPSGSADGLTLKDHPEYECRGIVCLKASGAGKNTVTIPKPEDLEKLLYAYVLTDDGKQLPVSVTNAHVTFSGTEGDWTLYVFAQKILFEGSHAQKCGWGPRRYPNLLDKAAISAFIQNTYENYEKHIPHMGERIDAIFTDEPSLMAGYINTADTFPYAAQPWQSQLPEKFLLLHGYDLMPKLHDLFENDSIEARTVRIQFQETVTAMIVEAYFGQINAWCGARGIKFSGHNLLEEHIGFHVVMNGNLFACLRNMSWPGVDILTCDPELFKHGGFHYMMASKFVGSAARAAGHEERVMVEICPVSGMPKEGYFTIEQLLGTMDLIFFSGINHINSYISVERFGENMQLYIDYFARIAYMLRNADWDGRIAMYYPIETAQALHTPLHTSCGNFRPELHKVQDTMRQLTLELYAQQLDYNMIDALWLEEARIEDGRLKGGKLSFSVMIMPCTMALPLHLLEKLLSFQKAGGTLLWIGEKPMMGTEKHEHAAIARLAESITLTEERDAAAIAKAACNDPLTAVSTEQSALWVSKYRKDGQPLYYVLNTSQKANTITLSYGGNAVLQVIQNYDGSIKNVVSGTQIAMRPYSSVLIAVETTEKE